MAAGYRSLLGYWAGVGGGTRRIIGPRSLLAFWMGGAAISYRVVPEEPEHGGGRRRRKRPGWDRHHDHLLRDDQDILEILMFFKGGTA